MNRLTWKLIAFPSLLGAAGALWGYFSVNIFGDARFLYLPLRHSSNAGWVVPIAFAIIFFTIWLAGFVVLKNPWKSFVNLHSLHYFVLPYLATASFMAMFLNQGAIAGISLAVYLLCLISGGIYQFRESSRQRKIDKERGLPQKEQKHAARSLVHIGVVLVITLALGAVIHEITSGNIESENNYAGFSIFMSWFTSSIASLEFTVVFWTALCYGAIAGLWSGFFTSIGLEQSNEINVSRLYICMAAGLLIGALVAGMTTGAQILQLVNAYDVAFEKEKLLTESLYIWGICGVLAGLLLAAFLHGLTGEKSERPRRLVAGFAWSLIPIIIAANWAVGYVKEKDLGREYFVEANKTEDNGSIVGMDTLEPISDLSRDYSPQVPQRGDLVIRIAEGEPVQARQSSSCSKTIKACDKLIENHPKSAYRSAALYLKSYLTAQNWQPEESLDVDARLVHEFPKQAFDRSFTNSRTIRDNVLLGDYEAAFKADKARNPNAEPDRGAIYAARILGKWDDVISLCHDKISHLQKDFPDDNKHKKEIIARYEKCLEEAKAKKAEGERPVSRTDVSGRIMIEGKPARDVTICLLPVCDEIKDSITNSLIAGGLGGRVGVTDDRGYYKVMAVPSGRYELLVVLDAKRFKSFRYGVRAKGVPFKVKGKMTTAPAVELFTQQELPQQPPVPLSIPNS
ncbi:MAG: hypothetical protein ABFD64_05315 [Armatimonadota bacterium]